MRNDKAISYRFEQLERRFTRLACEASDATDFRSQADCLLKKDVGWDFAVWSTVDPATMLFTSCTPFGVQPSPAVEQQLLELEFAGEDVNLFTELALSNRHAGSLYVATGGIPERSRRFRELLQPIGCGDELRAIFKSGEITWGALVAYRTPDSKRFSEADTRLVSQLSGGVAEGLRHCLLRMATAAPHRLADGPGLLLLDKDGKILETTPAAQRWIALLGNPLDWQTTAKSLATKTRANGSITSLPMRIRMGQWLVLHSSPTDSGTVAIIIEQARDIHLTSVIADLYGLTPRERAVTQHVLQGRPTKEISLILRISSYTVQDHLKSIFDKVGARSRRELVSVFFNQHYVERRRSRSTPSPYGWYLDDDYS